MAGIMTGVGSSKARNVYCSTISSQNKVVRSYAQQLRSSVISNERRRDILNKMRSEMTAQQFRRPERRSVGTAPVSREYTSRIQTGTAANGNFSKIQTAVYYSERNYEADELPRFSDVRDNTGRAPVPIKTNVGKHGEHSSSEGKKSYDKFFTEESYESPEYIAPVINSYHYELCRANMEQYTPPSLIQTGRQSATQRIRKAVDNSFIHSQRNTNSIQTASISYSDEVKAVMSASENLEEKIKKADNIFRRKAVMWNMQIKQRRLKNQKYIVASADTDDSVAIESAQLIRSAADTVVYTGGVVRTVVNGTANGIEAVHFVAKNGIKVGMTKDVAKIATAVGSGIRNLAADTGNQLLKTKINKSKITDMGTEAVKQGLTEIRYADNVRKAILNTARTTVKTGYAVKNMPRNTREQVKRIRKNVKRTAEAAKATVAAVKKILTSKAGFIIIAALILILLVVSLLNGLATVVVTAITSLFSWLVSEDGSKDTEKILDDYSASIVEYIEKKQDEIDEIIEGFVCDKRQYPPYDEISELNQFGNKDIVIEDENSILAILAVLRYRELGDSEEIKFEFTEEEIQDVIDKFYTFEYNYTYGHCGVPYCKRKTTTTVYNEGTPYEYTVETTEYYCDVDHQWLHGEVTNHTADEVVEKYEFTDEEKALYEMYLSQIEAMMGDAENV